MGTNKSTYLTPDNLNDAVKVFTGFLWLFSPDISSKHGNWKSFVDSYRVVVHGEKSKIFDISIGDFNYYFPRNPNRLSRESLPKDAVNRAKLDFYSHPGTYEVDFVRLESTKPGYSVTSRRSGGVPLYRLPTEEKQMSIKSLVIFVAILVTAVTLFLGYDSVPEIKNGINLLASLIINLWKYIASLIEKFVEK